MVGAVLISSNPDGATQMFTLTEARHAASTINAIDAASFEGLRAEIVESDCLYVVRIRSLEMFDGESEEVIDTATTFGEASQIMKRELFGNLYAA